MFDGLSIEYDISVYVEKGTVEFVILDADDVKMYFDGMEQKIVANYEVEQSDVFVWKLSKLPSEHKYALAVYGSENAKFVGEIEQHCYIKRWQYIYNGVLSVFGLEPH